MRLALALVGCSFALLCMEMYSLWPYPSPKINPFPFHDQIVSKQSHMDYTFTRAGFSLMFWLVWYLTGKPWQLLGMAILSTGYLLDYLLIYNNPFALTYAFGREIPLSYTLFMIVSWGLIIIVTVIQALLSWVRTL